MDYARFNMLLKLARDFGHEQVRDAGFTDTEHAICTFLCFHDEVSQNTIANALMLDKTTVAKALRTMEAKGMINRSRNEQNRRENIIGITQAGKLNVSGSVNIYETWLATVCSCLTSNELQELDRLVDKITTRALELKQSRVRNTR